MNSKKMSQWISTQIFNLVHQNKLVYNTCWEDPRIDRRAMRLGKEDEILMITSAGCNALDYLLDEPRHIYAVDMNPRQNALLELKIAGIRNLDFEDFFQIFGRGQSKNFPLLYKEKLRPALPAFARKHWDHKMDYFMPSSIRNSFYYRGTSGLFATLLSWHINSHRLNSAFLDLFEAANIKEQQEIYSKRIEPFFWSRMLKWAMKGDAIQTLLGVPRAQREIIEKEYIGGIAKFIQDCFEAVCAHLPTKDNYFWWLYLTGGYCPDRCPEYLKPENFDRLKRGLVERVSTHNSTILQFLESHPTTLNRFVLLDHMDWLAANKLEVLKKQWQQIVFHAGHDTRILWRSGGIRFDFVDPIEVESRKGKDFMGDLLSYESDLAHELHQRDRVHTYGSFYIADLKFA